MSLFSRRATAATVARAMQVGTRLNGRRMAEAAASRLPEYAVPSTHLTIPTSKGPLGATLYRPQRDDQTPGIHVNLHGGGFVLNLTAYEDPICRAIAAGSGAIVLNVDYAVAPQHRFPAAAHQVYDVLCWIADSGDAQGWDPHRLTIGGQSAGGSLAAAGARLAFEKEGPPIALQVLHYPPLDLSVPYSAKRSVIAKPMLRPWMAEVFDTAYVPDRTERADRLVSPAGAADTADLTGIAPALVIAAEHDILRDEARRYAERLGQCDALVGYREIPGADHGYDLNDDAAARETYALVAESIQRSWSG